MSPFELRERRERERDVSNRYNALASSKREREGVKSCDVQFKGEDRAEVEERQRDEKKHSRDDG